MADAIPGKLTDTSLKLDHGISIEDWARAGETIGLMHRASPFWVGDWLLYGEDHWHEKYAQYVEETGLSPATLVERARISRLVPPERRNEHLSLTHHAIVAGLLPEQQTHLLALAAAQGWNTTTLRAEARRIDTRPKRVNQRPTLAEVGDSLARVAALFLDGDVIREDLVAAIAAWENRREE